MNIELLRQRCREADAFVCHAIGNAKEAVEALYCASSLEDDDPQFWLSEAIANLSGALRDARDALQELAKGRDVGVTAELLAADNAQRARDVNAEWGR